ncbi:[acyl-carrier-protein] S-malonyltransferase [Aureococcus anophagefferens]|nr:[acyl-carrier-protein] S-malonyltransferase [Aureococcus anophagefferens]
MVRRICAFLCGVAAFQHPQHRGYARRTIVVKNGDALVECALVPGAAAKVEGWLDGWSASPLSDPQFPVTVDASTPTIRVRYVAMPDNGVDVAYRPAGSDSPFGAVVVERAGRPPRPARALDPKLYDGSYGEDFEAEVLDLFDAGETEAGPADATVQAMFAAGEALARAAAGEAAAASSPLLEDGLVDVEQAQFDVALGNGLKGGVDILAAPQAVRGAASAAVAAPGGAGGAAPAEASPLIAARFDVLLREVMGAADASVANLVADAYRDVLLDAAFPALARHACDSDEAAARTAAALDTLNGKVIDLVTQLAEMAAFAEKNHLETIRLLCDSAKSAGDAGLRDAARKFRHRLDEDFVAYLKHAIAVEAAKLRDRGVADPANAPSEWLAVLDGVRTAAYAELAKDVHADVDVIKNVLAIKDPAARRECLRLNVEGIAGQPDRVRAFRKTANNIFDNFLDSNPDVAPGAELVAALAQLRADLEFSPGVADDGPPPSTTRTARPELEAAATKCGADARLRLVTFPNSGSAENVYTGADKTAFGGASGRRDNELMVWAKKTKVEVYAAQPPGRDTRMREECLPSAAAIASAAFDVCEKDLFKGGVPWAIFAHSMGTWVAYEFCLLARAKGHPAPTVLVASGFPSPTCPMDKRPWAVSKGMSDDEFKDEARGWSINEVVFSEGMWKMWTGKNAPLDCPVRTFYGSDDKRATKELARSRRPATVAARDFIHFGNKASSPGIEKKWPFDSVATHNSPSAADADVFGLLGLGLERGHERLQRQRPIKGHHLFVYDEPARATWFKAVIGDIESFQPMAPLKSYLCTAKKGAAVRAGCELSTAQVQPEIDNGWLVDVSEEQENSKGTVRLHIVAYTKADGAKTACDCWGSKKLFERPRGDAAATAPAADAVTAFAGTTATMHTVTGKNGAMMRAGCELDTPELGVTLEQGTECYVVEEAKNAKGSLRSRIVCYTANGSPYAAIDGWCTAKFLTVVDKTKVPIPEAGSKPFAAVFARGRRTRGNVMLFPGQGAQKVGMLAPYADTPGVKAMFKEASKIFGCDLLELVEKGPVEKLNDTRFSQVCVFLTSMAAVKKLQREDPKAVNNSTPALTLLKIRGDAMGAACDLAPSGMMTVVGLDDDALKKMMPDGVSIANQLFPKGRVLSGSKEGLAKVEAEVKAAGIAGSKTIVQPVSGAFHSPYMSTAADKLKEALSTARLAAPAARVVYSNVTAKPHDKDVESIKAKMCEQLMAGVLWEDTINDMAKRFPDVDNFYEPAPGRQLTSMMRRIEPKNQPKMKNVQD